MSSAASPPTTTLNNGQTLPLLGLGTWKSAPGQVSAAVEQAIQCGYRHIDCAYLYLNEKEVGEGIRRCIEQGICTREKLFVTSKLWCDSHAPEDVAPALQESLDNLGLDYLDMYLVHWPVALKKGVQFPNYKSDMLPLEQVPLTETWKALEACVASGKTKGIGVSNFSQKKLQEILEKATIPPAINQIERHPYLAQNKLVSYCKEQGIHVTAYSPLGSLDRPEMLKQGPNEPNLLEDPVIVALAAKHSVTPAQLLLQWALATGTSVIPKTVQSHRLVENFDAQTVLTLDEEDLEQVAALDQHRRYILGDFWTGGESPYTLENLWDES